MMEGITHKDMSESEPEEVPNELPNPKSSFVIPKVPRRRARTKQRKRVKKPKKEDNVFITNPVNYEPVNYHILCFYLPICIFHLN